MWHVTCSPRPPTLSQRHVDLHVWSYPDIVIYSKFHRNPFRGLGAPGGRNLPIPITLVVGFYNSLHALPCKPWLHFAWVVDDAKCIVVTRVCLFVYLRVCLSVCVCPWPLPILLHGPGCNLGNGIGGAPSCSLIGGFAIGSRVALPLQHSADAKCQRVLVLTL